MNEDKCDIQIKGLTLTTLALLFVQNCALSSSILYNPGFIKRLSIYFVITQLFAFICHLNMLQTT